jgi:hypothetical protein
VGSVYGGTYAEPINQPNQQPSRTVDNSGHDDRLGSPWPTKPARRNPLFKAAPL